MLSAAAMCAALLVLSLLAAGPAAAATVPLNGRSFDAACNAANAGDVITVPAGSLGGQNVTCQKAVTFQLDPGTRLASLTFSRANGPTVSGGTITGGSGTSAVTYMNATNVRLTGAHVNNMVYFEGNTNVTFDGNVVEPGAGGTSWSNGDMMDIYEQTRSPSNNGVTIANNVFHGLRAPSSSAHPDAIQLCNCGSASQVPTNIKIVRNRFYDNECMNIRANERDGLLVEQNILGDTVVGISGCGDFALDVYYANANVRYNTFPGKQKVQVDTGADVGQSQTWVGNAGIGMSTSCGAIRATYSKNVWTTQKCGSTDKQVSSLRVGSDGTPQAGSPVIDAGDKTNFPAQDFNGGNRYLGAAPDAGAIELGAGSQPGQGASAPAPAAPAAPVSVVNGGPLGKPGLKAVPLPAGQAAGAAAPSARDALVAAYGFDEKSGRTVRDASGNDLDGRRRGAAPVADGHFGRALRFNGSTSRVTVPDAARLRLTDGMTLEAWVKPASASGQRLVLGKGSAKGVSYGLWAGAVPPAASVRTVRATASRTLRARGKTKLPIGRWSHVAVTFNGSRVRIYVDGEWIASRTAPGALAAATGALRIGGGATRATAFKGLIDEVRIYDRALTGAEIQNDETQPIGS